MNNRVFVRLSVGLCLLFSLSATVKASADLNLSATVADSTKNKKSAEQMVFPVPPADPKTLFYLQRTSNTATVMYELNIDSDGKLNEEEPMHVYWIRYNEHGQKAELNYIQRKFAYGLVQKQLGEDKYDIRFVSYKKFPMTLMKAADGKYRIFATVAQKQMALQKVFIKIEGGSFWLPNIVYVEMKGTDPATGKDITERFKP
ncbi:DUF4833 domain-containing protein [Mucilaginibacter pedocola]|uniref:DUF4833 domain-containing protein n=1 Tax=Mucilaginibacter pedocola TaxID=1792845 RepID=A0A1S9PG96_9SPHI|nr:DUF4833 domain-containing protein [Mucilaginibacter pedocola]OOQ59981.1 DUF4833 domain-containing protein [Mucilaginibacter pedocola]